MQGDAMAMPFDDNSFDAVTMGFGLRNVADIQKALRDVVRVLKPRGTAAILDFNHSPNPIVDGIQVLDISLLQPGQCFPCCCMLGDFQFADQHKAGLYIGWSCFTQVKPLQTPKGRQTR
jgi:SAM-dependent methyltransferase